MFLDALQSIHRYIHLLACGHFCTAGLLGRSQKKGPKNKTGDINAEGNPLGIGPLPRPSGH